MRCIQRILVMASLAILLPVMGSAPPAADPQDGAKREQLEKLRVSDPQQYARLRHNLAVLVALPAERQEALRKLGRDLQDEEAASRTRLEKVSERYNDWLERLPDVDRQSVLAAADRKARLQRVREIRDRQWVDRLPKARADKLGKTPEADRPQLLKKWRQDDLDERLDWQVAQRRENWEKAMLNPGSLPTRLDQLAKETREAVEKNLRPLLSGDEEKLLKEAEGKWPRYPRTVVELADSHPITVLGPIASYKDLHPMTQSMLDKDRKTREKVKEAEGKWPEFGVACKEFIKPPPGPFGKKLMIPPLHPKFTPSRPQEFSAEVRQFIEKKLIPALDDDEMTSLRQAEEKWPNYPQRVVELARKHNLQVPNTSRFDSLDRYRWRPVHGMPRRDGPWPPS